MMPCYILGVYWVGSLYVVWIPVAICSARPVLDFVCSALIT